MRLIVILLAALSAIALSGLLQARSAVLVEPEPVAVPPGLTTAQVTREIKRSLLDRGWELSAERRGEIEATLHVRAHRARIAIRHDRKTITIRYLDSTELNYAVKDGRRLIHPKYNGWVAYLIKSLRANLGEAALGGKR